MNKLLFTAIVAAIYSSSVGAIPITQSVTIGPGANLTPTGPIYNSSFSGGPNPVATRTLTFNQFNANAGVLTGVTSGLNFSQGLLQLSAQGTRNPGNTPHTFSSSGSAAASSNLAGLPTFGPINNTLSNSCSNCPTSGNLSALGAMNKNDSSWFSPTAAVAAASLNTYVGLGSLASTLSFTSTVTRTSVGIGGNNRAELDLTGVNGTQNLTYDYLNHANASFTSAIDTNELTQDVSAGEFDFSIFNFGPLQTTKLDSVSYTCSSGDCLAFDLDLLAFQDLIFGSSVTGAIGLTAAATGMYSASYTLRFSDDTAVGATSTHRQNSLALNVFGNIAAPDTVPEPATLALLGLSLAGLGFSRRKQ